MSGVPRLPSLTFFEKLLEAGRVVGSEPKPPALPFFLDPEQIAALTPEVDWSRRVEDRIRDFLEWGRLSN